MTNSELQKLAKSLEIVGVAKMRKHELIINILDSLAQRGFLLTQGILEVFQMVTAFKA